ncbi:MAG: amino acid ABC transporter permease [Synechococcus sp. SB0673_bin_10]|nr:amino acid ABC transporter permease [Cyanobacteria bacterium MAG IRC3_bin_20]MXX08705.1 amino acid ABC transporter permease [Synechococcus sp. SB0667_bin_8]MYI71078.1 amino acid ABC transporter permease [Synechococcus sp. SB0673_bin_10]MYK86568.1 amino acid ABC transporter permease [Synechococcus sp. SB0669_bin_7]
MAESPRSGPRSRQLLLRIRRGLFASPLDTGITMVLAVLCGGGLWSFLHWVFLQADWAVVVENIRLYIHGRLPVDQVWRSWSWLGLLGTLCLVTLMPAGMLPRPVLRLLPLLWILILPIGLLLLASGLGLEPVKSRFWGGLQLSLLLTLGTILMALPLGILLALARRSSLPLLRWLTTGYIEITRGMPLIAVLFFGQLMIPLFLPEGWTLNRVLRAVLSLGFFVAAYMAEDVRGGLQAIPRTQLEAARSLGLSPLQTIILVELPQALRTALPSLANQCVASLQSTSLLAYLGLIELLGISRSILGNPDYLGRHLEVYIWLALLYWLVCILMTSLARRVERSLNVTGHH